MNYAVLKSVIPELARILVNAGVERVYENASGDIVIVLRNQGRGHFLLASPDRSMPRIHLIGKKPPAALSMHSFTLYLKSRATGGKIAAVSLLNQDRVVELRFRRQNEEHHLIFELTGTRSNMILTDSSGLIEAIYHPVRFSASATRMLQAGWQYVPPQQKTTSADKGVPGRESAEQAPQPQPGPAPCNRDAEAFYDRLLDQKRFSSVRTQLRAAVEKYLKRTERRRDAIESDEKESGTADELRRTGELILANLNRIGPGMTEIELVGYDGRSFLVSLDPRRSAAGNADQYFKRYKKSKSGREIRAARLQESREESSVLRGLQQELEQAATEAELAGIRTALEKMGYGRPEAGHGNRARQRERTSPETASFHRIHYRGWEIIVGKSAAGNDHITFKMAGPNDLWLHAEGIPGSHVLVRNPENREMEQDILLKAAALAAFYSKGRSAGKVAVTYTFARHVKKPRGAKPGLVSLMQRRTIIAVPEKE
ncbi:MAG: hypothetical protein A2010_03280 [Nitrospirae bacterium GWD2_57_9]|nr:MAG: hypothetical protein A2010_03280 [Nitrospirae bacterium GWD2_57_9]OGW48614.1 MAG: hypothetical protein A2078_08755 [Nitrospirae bacterium GWC2_57_9]